MATKKTKDIERTDVEKAIWDIAHDLRGSVDGWDFKNFVLIAMFYRQISEAMERYFNEHEWESGDKDFDYSKLADDLAEIARDEAIKAKGYFIAPSQLFCNIARNVMTSEVQRDLNKTLEGIFKSIVDSSVGTKSEENFRGLFDDFDVNSNKLGPTLEQRNLKLAKLIKGIADMRLADHSDAMNDSFGDAYQFLLTMYASDAGKSGGEFFTPADASELVVRLATMGRTSVNKIYDPCCGSGSLLLKAAQILGPENVKKFFGQEINFTNYNLCRINMFVHDVGYERFSIKNDDTLKHNQHTNNMPFDVIVSNPPYSIRWDGEDDPILINDERYAPAGVLAPKSKADMAFLMHMLYCLDNSGTAAIVCFPGIFYRKGAEQKIRKYMVDNNFVDAVIQLPSNLFFGTSIATCILILKKSRTVSDIAFIDASDEFVKMSSDNTLSQENIDNIIKFYSDRQNVDYRVSVVPKQMVVEKDYNLSVSSYVEKEDTRPPIDIKHINAEIARLVAEGNDFRMKVDEIIVAIEAKRDD